MMQTRAASGPVMRQSARPLASDSTLTAEYDRRWNVLAIPVGPPADENEQLMLRSLRIVRPTYILSVSVV